MASLYDTEKDKIDIDILIELLERLTEDFYYRNVENIINNSISFNMDKISTGDENINLYIKIVDKITKFKFKISKLDIDTFDEEEEIEKNFKKKAQLYDEIKKYMLDISDIIYNMNQNMYGKNLDDDKYILEKMLRDLKKYKNDENDKLEENISTIKDPNDIKKTISNYITNLKFCEQCMFKIRSYLSNIDKIKTDDIIKFKDFVEKRIL